MSKVNSSHLDSTSFWSDREEVPETSDVHLSNMMMLRWKMLRVEDPHIPIPSDSRIERYLLMYPQIFRNVVESSRRVFSSTRVPVLECWCSMVFEKRNKIVIEHHVHNDVLVLNPHRSQRYPYVPVFEREARVKFYVTFEY